MSVKSSSVWVKINKEMDKIEELEEKKDYDSAIVLLKDQINFLDGYFRGEKNQSEIDAIESVMRDRRILIRVFKNAHKIELLQKAMDDRIENVLNKISQIEKEINIKNEGR